MAEDWSDLGNKAESWSDLGTVVPEKKRTDGERLTDNLQDGALRNPTVADARRTYSNPLSALLPPMLKPGGALANPPTILDIVPMAKPLLAAKGVMDRAIGREAPAALDAKRERNRRETYNARSEADPFYRVDGSLVDKAKAGLATAAGQLLGGMTDPQNLVAPGKTVAGRIAGAVGANAGGDYAAQRADLGAGVQDRYLPEQTIAAAVLGGVIQGGIEGGAPLARAASRAAKPQIDAVKRKAGDVARDVGERLDRIGEKPIRSRANDKDWTDLGAPEPQPQRAPEPKARAITEADARAVVRDIGGNVTSGYRTPEHNAKVGGVKGSYHTRGRAGDAQAIDVVPPKGMTMADLESSIRTRMPGAKVINEGDHVHVQWSRGKGARPESLADDLERGLIAEESTFRDTSVADADTARSAGPSDRPSADGSRKGRPGAGNEASADASRDDAFAFGHIDDNHARLYGLGKKAEAGELDLAAADDLAKRMSPLIDWTDEPNFTKRERRAIRNGEPVSGRRMIDVAKDYARRFDEHGPEVRTSFYDPDKYHEAMSANRTDAAPRRVVDDNPIPEVATASPRPVETPRPDITDRALDYIRAGKRITPDRGPSLIQWLEKTGLRDEGGELSAMDADLWHRDRPFRRKIVRPEGRRLDEAAVAAQEAGFLPERFGDTDTRATPADLIAAMREELGGKPRYAREDFDGESLRQHADELEEVMHEAGIDPTDMTNAEIKAEIDAYFRQPARAAMGGRLASSKTGGPIMTGQRVSQPVATGQGPAYSGRTIRDLIDEVRGSLDLTHRQGRLVGRRALGEYDRKSGVVRTKFADDLDVLAHEAAHALEFTHKPRELLKAMRKHVKVLKTFDYDAKKARRHEGFAEWVRWYVTNPELARQKAPGFYDDFERALTSDRPDTLAALQNVQRDWDNYIKADSLEVGKADLAFTGNKGPIDTARKAIREDGMPTVLSNVFDRAYTWFVDDLYPLQQATRALEGVYASNKGKTLELKSAESPYVLARLGREGFNAGRVDALHGVVPYKGVDPEGPSLGDAITRVFGKDWTEDGLDGFDVYLASRRMIHEWDRFAAGELKNQPDKFSKAVHEQRIADFEAQHPQAREGAAIVYEWVGNLWRKEFEAGFLSEATYKAGLEKPDYVPLMRDVSDKGAGADSRSKGDLRNAGGAKQFRGSRRAVISPLTSMMKRSYELNMNIRRVEVIRALHQLAQRAGPGSGAILERLPKTEVKAYQTDALKALEKKLGEAGVLSEFDITTVMAAAEAGVQGDGKVTMFQRVRTKGRPDELLVFDWKDGKPVPLLLPDGEFGREMYTAISGMDREMRSVMLDVASGFTQALRTGVTLSPEFVVSNIVRDQLATWINTDVGFKPGISYARGAMEQLADGQMAKRYQAIGGLKGGLNTSALTRPLPRTDAKARAQRMDLNKANYRLRTFRLNQNPLRLAAALTDISETGSRLGVFRLAFDKAKKRGLTDYEAAVEAGITSRDYLDYGRHGSKMLHAVRLVTFLNSAIQGMDKAGRVLNASGADRPSLAGLRRVLAPIGKGAPKTEAEKRAVAHAWKAIGRISVIAAFGAGLTALFADDPEYQEFDDRERSLNWIFRAAGHWWKIPKPFELATPSNIAERAIEARLNDDPTAGDRMWSDLQFTIAPPHGVPILSVPFEIARNRDAFGRPIVPDYKAKTVDPELQYNAYTSKLSRALGQSLHTSPAVLDHIVTGFFGSLGRYGLQGADLAIEASTGAPRKAVGPEDAFLTRRFSTLPSRSSKSQARFWELVSQDGGEFTRAEGTFRTLMREAKDAEATAYLNRLKPEARAYVVAKVFSADGTSKLHPMVRAQEAVKVLSDVRGELRDGTLTPMTSSKPLRLTPEQMKRADDALSEMSMSEMRNALIGIGERGWAQKDYIPRGDARAELQAVGLLGIVDARMRLAKVLPAGATSRFWSRQRPGMEARVSEADLASMMAGKRLDSNDLESKRREVVRQMGR